MSEDVYSSSETLKQNFVSMFNKIEKLSTYKFVDFKLFCKKKNQVRIDKFATDSFLQSTKLMFGKNRTLCHLQSSFSQMTNQMLWHLE